jgi:hypothetical protein
MHITFTTFFAHVFLTLYISFPMYMSSRVVSNLKQYRSVDGGMRSRVRRRRGRANWQGRQH